VEPSHPDRNAQFEYLNTQTLKATAAGNPVLSIDAKKKEKLGNFKNNGRTYQRFKAPVGVLDHDFSIEAFGWATLFGVYDVFRDRGFVDVGLGCEAVVFVVEFLWGWCVWRGFCMVVWGGCFDLWLWGRSGYRSWLCKFELSKFVSEVGSVRVLYFPPGV